VADVPAVEIEFERIGKSGKARLTARFSDGTSFTDKIDLGVVADRRRFTRCVCKGRKGILRKDVAAKLERIAEMIFSTSGTGDGAEPGEEKLSQADRLVRLADGVELFHAPGGDIGYATVAVAGHRETWPLNGGGFRRWLARRYYETFGKAPSAQAVQDALAVLSGKAIFDGPEHQVAVRLAIHGGDIWLDLGDPEWRAVRISSGGWEVVTNSPIRFIRKRGMLALPVPVHGGSVDELRPLVNLPDDDQWVLYVAWLVTALRPDRPFPILAVNGEQGSAKSTLSKIARALIDPNEAPLRRSPKNDRDLMIAGSNGWVVGFDNLSGIAPDLSDALCCLSTGGGFGTRELYSDDEEKLFNVLRPVLINGIEDLLARPDLLDRAVRLTLPPIPDDRRQDEESLWAEFERVRPRVLGALLTAAACALRNLPRVKLAAKPQMADFAKWVTAAEESLGWPPGRFMTIYSGNRDDANALALETSPLGTAVLAVMGERTRWEGTNGELLELLNSYTTDSVRKSKDWPGTPRGLSGQLRRLAPNMRKVGIECLFPGRQPGGERRRLLVLERTGLPPTVPTVPTDAANRDGRDGSIPNCSSPSAEEVVEWTG
jgi:hypothetical protein